MNTMLSHSVVTSCLKMEATGFSKRLVYIYQTMHDYSPDDHNLK